MTATHGHAARYVYDFHEGSGDMRELLGGKGAGLAEMTRLLGADRVPEGFTITTEACVAYLGGGRSFPEGLEPQEVEAIARLEERTGKRLSGDDDPLLVSVRSGARESMPGMLDTVLNLGLNDRSVRGLAARTGDERFAWDSYRRFAQMYAGVVVGVPGRSLEAEIERVKRAHGARQDSELDAEALRELVEAFRSAHRDAVGEDLPQDPRVQLQRAIRAVFDSWNGDRAVSYRRIHRMPDDWGTAVNVQRMVFGNRGADSGSGVAFSRDELTGEPRPSGDFLVNAQGEDVVSGVRNTLDLGDLERLMPAVHAELLEILRRLEAHHGDMQDVEFTVEQGRLFVLQTRAAKRPAQAAVRFAADAVAEGLLTKSQALMTIEAGRLEALLHPMFDPQASFEVLARGVAASPGAARGEIVFTAGDAVRAAAGGRSVILVRAFTEAEDVAGFEAADGVLTSEGGKASHAALVARGMGVPAVTGASAVEVDVDAGELRVGGRVLHEGDAIAIDGTTGAITTDDVPLVEPRIGEHFESVLAWSDELRRLGVRANADTAADALRAREFGAEGIGLCRTEHMFFGHERHERMVEVILARDPGERRRCLAELEPLQQDDFEALLEAMGALPVTVRLLDPPLHEFLPHAAELEAEIQRARSEGTSGSERLERTLERVRALEETNPMLGTRGCRLALLHPEIAEMQIRALLRAATAVSERTGRTPELEVMIPLVGYERELELLRGLAERVAAEEGRRPGEVAIGTMIELPRACFVADRIAEHADFFSFGTNDLTQTALGFSRDDVEAKILARYIELKILDRSPFETLDAPGVGQLLRMGAWLGRKAKPSLKLGVCGEHGGDPDSIDFLHHSGIDYVSCSPYRIPVARVAAAQAAIRDAAASGDDASARSPSSENRR